MQYNDGDRIMQVKQFTPLYLTACAVMVQDYTSSNGAIPAHHHAGQGIRNGYLPGGPNGLPQSNSALFNGGAREIDYYDPSLPSVIASKSSGSITKYITSSATIIPMSRKISSSDVDQVFLISGTERASPMGLDLNSNANGTASEGTTAEDRELAEVMATHDTYAVEYGDGGRVYACHYV